MCSNAWMVPGSNDTSSGSAPASSSACHGRSSSTCSTPSVARTATVIPSSSPAMRRRYPGPRSGTHALTTTVRLVRVRTRPEVRRLLGRSLPARYVAGPGVDDAVRVAAKLIATGRRVSFAHLAADPAEDEAELAELLDR